MSFFFYEEDEKPVEQPRKKCGRPKGFVPSAATRAKIAAGRRGKKDTAEARARKSASQKARWAEGDTARDRLPKLIAEKEALERKIAGMTGGRRRENPALIDLGVYPEG